METGVLEGIKDAMYFRVVKALLTHFDVDCHLRA